MNSRLTDTEASGQGREGMPAGAKPAKFNNVGLCQFCHWALRTSLKSSFLDAVLRVVGMGSEKQMIRANARRIVAAMKHQLTIWYRAVRELPGDSVCAPRPSMRRTVTEHPIALRNSATAPRPAPIWFGALNRELPEASRQVWVTMLSAAGLRAKTALTAPHLFSLGEEHGSAVLADSFNRRNSMRHDADYITKVGENVLECA